MLEEGLSPISIPTQSIYRNRSPDLSDFKKYLSLGFTPLGMGDVILRAGMIKIISADDLLVALSAVFKPRKARDYKLVHVYEGSSFK